MVRLPRTSSAAKGCVMGLMDWQNFVDQCENVLQDIDDIPERGEDFAESVREKVEGMMYSAKDRQSVTDNMADALENIADGVSRWLS